MKNRKIMRLLSAILALSCLATGLVTGASAAEPSVKNIPGWSGVIIDADISIVESDATPASAIALAATTISSDTYKTFGSYYFGSTSRTITVTVTTTQTSGFNLTVWLQNSTGDIVGPVELVRNTSGSASWTVRLNSSGTYTVYVYNNSNSSVSISVSVS